MLRLEHKKCDHHESHRHCRELDLDIAANLPKEHGWSFITPDGYGIPGYLLKYQKEHQQLKYSEWEQIPLFSGTADGMLSLMGKLRNCSVPYNLKLDTKDNDEWKASVGDVVRWGMGNYSTPVRQLAESVWSYLANEKNQARFRLDRNISTLRKFDDAKCPGCGGGEMYLVNEIRMQWGAMVGFCPECNKDFATGGDPEHAETLRRGPTVKPHR